MKFIILEKTNQSTNKRLKYHSSSEKGSLTDFFVVETYYWPYTMKNNMSKWLRCFTARLLFEPRVNV